MLSLLSRSRTDTRVRVCTRAGLTRATAGQVEAREQEEGEGERDARMDSVRGAILRLTDSRVSLSE